jgi:hypothetical protein
METIPFWTVVLAICGGIVTIIGALEKVVGVGKAVNAPNVEQDRRLAALEARCDKYDEYFSVDKHRMDTFEQSMSILMQAEFALLSHAINGNDIDKLKEVQGSMMEYLTKRGINV